MSKDSLKVRTMLATVIRVNITDEKLTLICSRETVSSAIGMGERQHWSEDYDVKWIPLDVKARLRLDGAIEE